MTATLPPAPPALSGPAVLPPLVVAPPRLNFAGNCHLCGVYACTSPRCVTRHANSWWATCSRCAGTGLDADDEVCGCLYGVMQVTPVYPGAVQGQ